MATSSRKESQHAYSRRHYIRNRVAILARSAARQKKYPVAHNKAVKKRQQVHRDILRKLREVPCQDCGGHFPAECMDFDHRDRILKRFNIMQHAGAFKIQTLLDEVAKCDIVCANCHRIRTRKQSESLRQMSGDELE